VAATIMPANSSDNNHYANDSSVSYVNFTDTNPSSIDQPPPYPSSLNMAYMGANSIEERISKHAPKKPSWKLCDLVTSSLPNLISKDFFYFYFCFFVVVLFLFLICFKFELLVFYEGPRVASFIDIVF